MTKLKMAGLWVVVCGLSAQAFARAKDPQICLENFAQAERELHQRVAELSDGQRQGYGVLAVSGSGWLYCIYRVRSVPGIVACTGLLGLFAATGYKWADANAEQIKKIQDNATIMRLYSAIKVGGGEASAEVQDLAKELKVLPEHVPFLTYNVVTEMEKGSLCDQYNIPNTSWEDFQALIRPGNM